MGGFSTVQATIPPPVDKLARQLALLSRVVDESAILPASIKSSHIAPASIKSGHIDSYQVLRAHVATGQLYAEHFSGTREISSPLSIASGVIYKEHARVVDITTQPLPNASTVIAYGRAFVDSAGNPIVPLGGAYPTSGGVAGYVMEAARSSTTITLIASVSGVVARVVVYG